MLDERHNIDQLPVTSQAVTLLCSTWEEGFVPRKIPSTAAMKNNGARQHT